jgi:hypothetical protein
VIYDTDCKVCERVATHRVNNGHKVIGSVCAAHAIQAAENGYSVKPLKEEE